MSGYDPIDDDRPPQRERPRAPKPKPSIMSLGSHLEELRSRIIWALVGILPIFLGALAAARTILEFLMVPVQDALRAEGARPLLISTGVLETFDTWLKVAVMMTIIVGSPWLLWQAWLFVAPGLYRHEKRFVRFLLPLSTVLIAVGVAFLYFAVLPVMLHFFIHFGSTLGKPNVPTMPLPAGIVLPSAPVLEADPQAPTAGQIWVNKRLQELRVCVVDGSADGVTPPKVLGMPLTSGSGVEPSFRVSEYVSLLTTLAIAFAAAFQTPVVVLLLGWAGIVTPTSLAKYRRHAAMIVAIIAALLTPADVFSMLLMGIPMYLLYELGGILLRFFPAKRLAAEDDHSDEDGPRIDDDELASAESRR